MPLFLASIYGINIIFSPPPRTGVRNLGFVMAPGFDGLNQRMKESYLDLIAAGMNREIKRLSPQYLSISTVQKFMDMRPFRWTGYDLDIEYTYNINLNRPLNDIWSGFGKDCRAGIRAVTASETSCEATNDVDTFYHFMEKRYREQNMGFALLHKAYLADILATFPDNVKLFVVKNKGEVIDVEISCAYKDRYRLWMGGATIQKGSHGNQEYSTWELLKKAKDQGYDTFEIMGANVRRLCRFQSKFNPDLELYFTISKKSFLGRMAEWSYINVGKKYSFSNML